MFSFMKTCCPICMAEMEWMRGYGRDARCCGKECYREFEWRRTLAIMGKSYYPQPGSRADPLTPASSENFDLWREGKLASIQREAS